MPTLYVATGNYLRCYTDSGGSTPPSAALWSYNANAPVRAVAVDQNGAIFIAAGISLYKLDINGSLLWSRNHGAAVYGVAVDSIGNCVLAGSASGQIAARKYNPDGTQLWTKNYNYYGYRAVAIDSTDMIYLGGENTGAINLRRYSAAGVAQGEWDIGGEVSALAIDDARNVYCSIGSGGINNVKKYSSAMVLQWETAHGEAVYGIAISDSGHTQIAGNRYIGSQNMATRRYNAAGDLVWSHDPGASGLCVAIAGGGITYVGGSPVLGSNHSLHQYAPDGTLNYSLATGDACLALALVEPPPVLVDAPAAPLPLALGTPGSALHHSAAGLAMPLALGAPGRFGGASVIHGVAPALRLGLAIALPLIVHERIDIGTVIYRAAVGGSPVLSVPIRQLSIRKSAIVEVELISDALDLAPLLAGRLGAALMIQRGSQLLDGTVILSNLADVVLTHFAIQRRPGGASITLIGAGTLPPFAAQIRSAAGVSYRSADAARRARCAVDTFLAPGDRLLLPGGEVLRPAAITLTITPDLAVMEVSD